MSDSPKRNIVFVSHATPDDNEFSLWISTRLKLAGYEVWSDVTQLFGGEKFWDDIEDAISNFTCKFIIVITRTSLSKPGVIREIEYAIETENTHKISNFIVPIIIDDSSFSSQPFGFSDRNIIPFRDGWADGFGRLIERFTRDEVPKSNNVTSNLGEYINDFINPESTLIEQPDVAVTNWLNVERFPEVLNFYRLPINSNKFKSRFSSFPFPWFEYSNKFVSFCKISDMNKSLHDWERASADLTLDVGAVLNGGSTNYPDFNKSEVIKKLNFILSNAWSKAMREKGLHCYTLANGKEAYFFPDSDEHSGQLTFPDIHGVSRRRKLVGFSTKNNAFWHFAIEVKAMFGYQPKICLIPHVVFSEDGKNPLTDKSKMHRLRRGFCKNWWNDRWRDMLLTYLYHVSSGNDSIDIPVGSDTSIILSARPVILKSPVSINLDEITPDVSVEDEDIEVVIDEIIKD